jgi:hypothetical protein
MAMRWQVTTASKVLLAKLFLAIALLSVAAATAQAQDTVTVTPSTISFGSVGIGLVAHAGLQVTNNSSNFAATITGFQFSSNSQTCTVGASGCIFGLREGEFPQVIPPQPSSGATTRWSISVRPTTAGSINGTLTVNYYYVQGTPLTATATLTGTAVSNTGLTASLSATDISFGNVPLGTTATQQVTVTNTSASGSQPYNVTAVYSYPPFAVTGFSGTEQLLNPGQSLTLTVSYSPSLIGLGAGLGASTGFLTVEYDIIPASGVSLSGIGVAPSGLAVTSYPNLPSAIQGAAYQATLQATGGTPPYTNWQITSGAPQEISINSSTGVISGTVSSSAAAQSYTLQVQVQDSTTPTPLQATATLTLPVNATTGANCSNISWDVPGSSTPLVPINDLGTGTYFPSGATTPAEGGLYPNGLNIDSSPHGQAGPGIGQSIVPLDPNGSPDPVNGVLGFISIGPSTTFDSFEQLLIEGPADPAVNRHVVFVNGANPNETAELLSASPSTYWPVILDYIIPFAGVTNNQIVAAWVDSIDSISCPPTCFPADAAQLQGELEAIAQQLYTNFPNIKVAYFGSLNYTGYSNGLTPVGPNPEPQAYDIGFSDKWAIQDQIDGTCSISGQSGACLNYDSSQGQVMAPWIEWGPYYWANGLLARQDGTTWSCEDLQSDGTHPSLPGPGAEGGQQGGENKINEFLLNFLKTDPTATPWFLASAVALSPSSLAFGGQTLGTTSAVKTVTLTNTGGTALNITSISLTGTNPGDFGQTNNCGTSVAAGANCTISVTFTPSATGARSASVSIADEAVGSPQTAGLTGTGTTSGPPVAALAPASLTFATQVVGTKSGALPVTLTNTGGTTLSITAINLAGTNPGDFGQTNTCGTNVISGASCTISVTFTPAASGTRTALLSITDNAAGSPQTVPLTGTGGASVVSLSPGSLTFPLQVVGESGSPQTVTLTNTGTSALSFSGTGISVTTDPREFSETNTCGTSVAAGASCTITVTFTPKQSSPPASSGTLSISDNAAGSPQTVALSGTGTFVELVPGSLTFASQAVGTTSAVQTVTFTNTLATQTLAITPSLTGTDPLDFAQSNTCGGSVGPGVSCTFGVTFTPAAAGLRTATLSIADAGGASPQTVVLTGTGTGSGTPAVTLSPSTGLTFASQTVGTISAPQAVTLSNTGSAALSITSLTIAGASPGDFAQTNNCGTSVAAGANCTINVTFTPAATGTRSAVVSVADNATGSPQSVNLTGTGTAAGAPTATPTPNTLTFTGQSVGTSKTQTVTLTNTGSATLSITNVSITGANSGDFAQTNSCGTSLAAGASCTISITFTPAAPGTRTASITIADNAPNSPQTVALTGNNGPVASLLPSPGLTFPQTSVGSASATQTVTLTNTGGSTLTVMATALTGANNGDFTFTSTCVSTLQPGANCSLIVTFKPTTTGSRSASITITDNAPGSPQSVALSGTGITTAGASVSPGSLTFSTTQSVGTTSPVQTVTLTNTGSATLNITSVSVTSSNFGQTSTCGVTLAAGASCTISVYFKPGVAGALTGSLIVADNAPDAPQAVALTGTGMASGVGFQPASLVFKGQPLNTASAPQTVTLTNTGTAALSISSVAFTGSDAADFTQTNSCPSSSATLSAGGTCTISVVFNPTTSGNLSAALTVTDNAPGSPHSLGVSGAGSGFELTAPTSTATVTAGQPASYALSFAATGGFSGMVTLSCTTTAPAASCSVAPATLTLNAPNTATATATVTTTANGAAPPRRQLPSGPGPWLWWALAGAMAVGLGLLSRSAQRTRWVLAGALVVVLAWAGCGGGSSSTSTGPTSTPAGKYQVTVTANAATVSQNVTLTLTVQ